MHVAKSNIHGIERGHVWMRYHISEADLYLFHQGTNYYSERFLGIHPIEWNGEEGYRFAVWAPHAKQVSVVGEFNDWQGQNHPLESLTEEGVWAGFFTNVSEYTPYKFEITTTDGRKLLKSDPYAQMSEIRPANASLVPVSEQYDWKDDQWISSKNYNPYSSAIAIYEVHLGTWKTKRVRELAPGETKDAQDFYTYRELIDELIPYVKALHYTHIELLPLAEHPFDRSWGYQITGFFSVTSRYGTPNDFKAFVDACHQHGLGVIMDWVPAHFCKDDFGLRQFDGRALYEYEDLKKADKKNWGTLAFDYGRPEVQSFLISNALFWVEDLHMDGLRIDAIASMLFLNFDRPVEEEKIYNTYGGEENLEAYAFLRKLNEVLFQHKSNVLMMAEDSSDVPLITSPTSQQGLGFNYKWNMGWMNDTLAYMKQDPIHRKWHHHKLTFSFMYVHSENFLLPLSHDEVIHGKKSLLDKMPGDQWQQFANLRLLYGYMMGHPGKKLLFMGGELGQYAEWKDLAEVDWHLLDYPTHQKIQQYVQAINLFYQQHPALYTLDHQPSGFEWIDPHNAEQSVIAFLRKSGREEEKLVIVCNFTPTVHYDYNIGVPHAGVYKEIFNSDAEQYGGSGQLNQGKHFSIPGKWHGLEQSIQVKLAPLAISVFQKQIEE